MRWKELQHRRGSWTIWKLGVHWSVASLGLFSLFSVSSAGPHIESQPNRMLQPCDQDYPKINSSPSHTVQFRAVIPDGVSAEFHLIYGVATRQIGSAFSAPRGCRWSQATPFYVDLPLKSERSEDGYRGIFSADYFQSGECGWDLYSLGTYPCCRARQLCLCSRQERSRGSDPLSCQRTRAAPDHRQCGGAGSHPDGLQRRNGSGQSRSQQNGLGNDGVGTPRSAGRRRTDDRRSSL